MRFRSVSRSISRTFLIPTATCPAIARASSTRRVASATIRPSSSSSATSGAATRPRRDRVDSSGPSSASGIVGRALDRGGCEMAEPEVVSAALDQVDVARLGVEQPACAVGDRRQELLERLGPRDRLGELGQRLELVDAALHLAVQPGVLDRARDERCGGDDEVDLVAARTRAAPRCARRRRRSTSPLFALDRDGEERLEPLLLELRDVLDAGVVEEVLAGRRRARDARPPTRRGPRRAAARSARRGARTARTPPGGRAASPSSSTR